MKIPIHIFWTYKNVSFIYIPISNNISKYNILLYTSYIYIYVYILFTLPSSNTYSTLKEIVPFHLKTIFLIPRHRRKIIILLLSLQYFTFQSGFKIIIFLSASITYSKSMVISQ